MSRNEGMELKKEFVLRLSRAHLTFSFGGDMRYGHRIDRKNCVSHDMSVIPHIFPFRDYTQNPDPHES